MRTIKSVFLVLFVGLSLQSCNLLGDLAVVTLPGVKFTAKTPISVSGTSAVKGMGVSAAAKTFNSTGVVNLADIEEIKDQLAKVKGLDITDVTISVDAMSPDGTTVTGFSLSFPDLKITKSNLILTGSALSLNFTKIEMEKLAAKLLAQQPLNYEISGTVSNAPVTFTITQSYTADIKVGVLN